MRLRLRLVGTAALITALGAGVASPAVADSQQVGVQDNVFTPPGVAVKPGESVMWRYPGGGDHHNVSFEDGLFTNPPAPAFGPWDATRTFNTEGTFRYYCQEHGGPGGQGMAGLVYVNATGTVPGVAPTASFTSPSGARVNQTVGFDATGSTDPDPGDLIRRYEWDLDGNSFYETDTGATPTTSTEYSTAGPRTVKLRVTDDQGHTNETTRPLSVTNPPTASFTVSPSPAQKGQTVSFDGSASSDPAGAIAKYEWDLDGNGSYEKNTAATPTTSRAYTTPASLNVKLRVTGNDGVSAGTTRSLRINAPAPLPAPSPGTPTQPILPTTPAKAGCSSLKGAKRTACVQKSCTKLKGSKRARCVEKSCRYVNGNARARCIQKSCRSLKGGKRAACNLTSCRALKGSKKRACVKKYRRKR